MKLDRVRLDGFPYQVTVENGDSSSFIWVAIWSWLYDVYKDEVDWLSQVK